MKTSHLAGSKCSQRSSRSKGGLVVALGATPLRSAVVWHLPGGSSTYSTTAAVLVIVALGMKNLLGARTIAVLLAACWTVSLATAQNDPSNRFEVASVKPFVSSLAGVTVQPSGRVVLSGMGLKALIGTAFQLSYWQISGGEDWMGKDLYIIEAKAPENSGITNFNYSLWDIDDAHLREMLQAVLIDRFQLRVHRETKTGDVYQLTRTDKPLGLKLAKIPEGRNPASIRGDIGYAVGRWVIRSLAMPQLAKFASRYVVHTSVVDLTNLSGAYDYTQSVRDEVQDQNYTDNTDSFLRLLKEVGLELKRARGPVETLVIDSAARPSPN